MATRRTTKTTKTEEAKGTAPAPQKQDKGATDTKNNEPVKAAAPKHVTVIDGNAATITPVDQADIPVIAARLLDAADHPHQVATMTSPTGWRTTKTIATRAGLD